MGYNAAMNNRYHIKACTQVKVAKPGETPQEHVTQTDQVFEESERVASTDSNTAARWISRGYRVFKRGDWYLIVDSMHVEIEYCAKRGIV